MLDIVTVGVAGMALEWKREDVLLLLSCYKEHPVLWNVKLTEYRDRNAKEITYLKIHEVMQNDIQNITTEQIKKKIHTQTCTNCVHVLGIYFIFIIITIIYFEMYHRFVHVYRKRVFKSKVSEMLFFTNIKNIYKFHTILLNGW